MATTTSERIYRLYRDQINSGKLGPGTTFPSLYELSKDHRVALPTIEAAFLQLKSEGLIEILYGKPTVINRYKEPLPTPMALSRAIMSVFEQAKYVKMEVRSITAESFIAMLEEVIRHMRSLGGHLPESVDLKLLISDRDHVSLPFYVDDPRDGSIRERMKDLIDRSGLFGEKLRQLAVDELVRSVSVRIRADRLVDTPGSKYYYLESNKKACVLEGPYEHSIILKDGREVCEVYGYGTLLREYDAHDPYARKLTKTFRTQWECGKELTL
jgi:DNA-binding transcriptional regulator YhcF (GntR family)